jgi:hypothetical protein
LREGRDGCTCLYRCVVCAIDVAVGALIIVETRRIMLNYSIGRNFPSNSSF